MHFGAAIFYVSFGLSCETAQAEISFKKEMRAENLSIKYWEENRDCLAPEFAKLVVRQAFANRDFKYWDKIKDWPEIEGVPPVVIKSYGKGRDVLITEKSKWVVKKTQAPKDGVIVLFHPLCSPSRRALSDLASEEILRDAFFLAPASQNYEISIWEDWSKKYPDWKMQVVYKQREWPEIKSWATPTFIFMSNGEIVHTTVGWPPEGNFESFNVGIRKIKKHNSR